jgi:hypothetical protein
VKSFSWTELILLWSWPASPKGLSLKVADRNLCRTINFHGQHQAILIHGDGRCKLKERLRKGAHGHMYHPLLSTKYICESTQSLPPIHPKVRRRKGTLMWCCYSKLTVSPFYSCCVVAPCWWLAPTTAPNHLEPLRIVAGGGMTLELGSHSGLFPLCGEPRYDAQFVLFVWAASGGGGVGHIGIQAVYRHTGIQASYRHTSISL